MVATASLYKEAKTSKIREGLRKYVQNLRGDRIKYEKKVIQPPLYAELDSLMDARQQARLAGDPIDGFRIEFEGRHYRDALDASRRRLYGAERDTEIARGLTGLGGAALLGGGAYALNKALKNRAAKAVAEEALPEIASKGSNNLLPLVAGGIALPASATAGYFIGSGEPDASSDKIAGIRSDLRKYTQALTGSRVRKARTRHNVLLEEAEDLGRRAADNYARGYSDDFHKKHLQELEMRDHALHAGHRRSLEEDARTEALRELSERSKAGLKAGLKRGAEWGAVIGGSYLTAQAYKALVAKAKEGIPARKALQAAAAPLVEEVLPEIASKRSKNLLPLAAEGVATPAAARVAAGVAVPTLAAGAYLAGSGSPEVDESKIAHAGAALLQLVKERAPYALAGAALTGGLHEGMTRGGAEGLREELAQAEAEGEEGSFRDALNTAQLKARLAFQEAAEKHPRTSLGMSALAGGVLGAVRGPAVADQIKGIGENVKFLSKG